MGRVVDGWLMLVMMVGCQVRGLVWMVVLRPAGEGKSGGGFGLV